MTPAASATRAAPLLPAAVARRFEAIMFDWDGTAVSNREADAARLRGLVEDACAVGIELAIVTGRHLGSVDGRLLARPSGPGRLVLALNRGSEIFSVDGDGARLIQRRVATAEEEAALSRAAELGVERLAARGLRAQVISERLNRRTIDLMPEPDWVDPPKPRIADLLTAVQARLAAAGLAGLTEAVAIARDAAADAGLADPRVTSAATHVEIGLTDTADSARWIMNELWRRGVGPDQVLVAGDELGPLGGLHGSDSNLLVDGVTAVSVGVEPNGVPAGVIWLGGGPDMFAAVLEDQIARRRNGELPLIHADPEWTLTVDDTKPDSERVHESLLTLADGRLGTRGSMLAADPLDDPSVLLAGVYTGQGPETELLAGPKWNTIEVGDGTELSTRRVLDLRTGTLFHQRAHGRGQLEALLLSSLARPATTLLRVHGSSAGRPALVGLRAPAGAEHEHGMRNGCSWTRVAGSPGSIVAASYERVFEGLSGGEAGHWVLDRLACYDGLASGVADERTVLERVLEARQLGFDELFSEHRRAWAARWEDADINLDGDGDLQLAIRLALFHLMASVADQGEAAVGARGLSGRGYRGHVFWDSDVYVLPFLAATHPDAARAMLEYRVRRMPASLRAARAQGHAGARFAWESAASGDDMTPLSVRNDEGGVDSIYTGQQEEHIVADVAWAAAHYIDWTGDEAFAATAGLELLVQTARWWASRIELDGDGGAHIRDVMGPDEYHEHVDDDAYTNVMARWNLRRAARAAANGQVEQSERYRWLELAESIVDGYDPATGIYEQFAGFNTLEPLVISELAPQRPVAADMLLGHERTRGAQVVKQPDVLMLHYLVPGELATDSLVANLDFYDPRTSHGSTLSPGVHAALMARSGRLEQAVELLRLTARIDLDDIGGVTAGGVHLAAMGSVWRALAFGFAGIAPADDALSIDPVLPPTWHTLELPVTFRGSRVRIRARPGAVEVTADPPAVIVNPAGERVTVGSTAQAFETSRASVTTSR